MVIKDKNIVLGVTGGIAVYKALELARQLVKEGANIWPIMTKAAAEFITPLSLSTLARNTAYTDLFTDSSSFVSIDHIGLASKADIFVIAPATANTIGKIASGIADNLLTTAVMATKAPVLFAPAMNPDMYTNPIVNRNIKRLQDMGYHFVGPERGELACGKYGEGRLSAPEAIIDTVKYCLSTKDLSGEKILVTAGPTREAIDPIRFISNPSSGRMGYALAAVARRRGAEVVLVSGPSHLIPPADITFIRIKTAEDMSDAALNHYPQSSIVIMAAAVSDYKPKTSHKRKVKKEETSPVLELERTKDILKEMGQKKSEQFLVGFALETEDLIENARRKLMEKNLDIVVANGPSGLDAVVSEVTLIDKDGRTEGLPPLSKEEVAERILDKVVAAKKGSY